MDIKDYQIRKMDRWLSLWVSTEVAKARSLHSYWPNQTKEVIYNAQKVYDWLQGIEPENILNINDADDSPDEEEED